MVSIITQDFTIIMEAIKEAMKVASEEGDDRSEDMLNAINQSLEKHVWMLNAFLGK